MHKPITITQIALSAALSISPAFVAGMCTGLGAAGVVSAGIIITLSLLASVLVAKD